MEIAHLYQIFLKHPSVQTDTRRLKPGDLFFALKGPNFNGNHFAHQAIEQGAEFSVIDEPQYATGEKFILVKDVLETLQELARYHRDQFSIPFIAITGSNGKTTTKELVTTVLQQRYKTYATEGNLNNHIGVPLTLLKIREDAEMAVIEMGANHQKEIEAYCKIAKPTHGIITNVGKAHIEGFGGEEGVRKGKGELYDALRASGGAVFRNVDLPYLEDMAAGISNQITYGSSNAKYIGRPLTSEMFLKVAVFTSGSETTIHTNLVGSYNFPNVMVAVATGLHFGIPVNDIRSSIESYQPDNSRSQFLMLGGNRIILDAYNANPTSMRAAIDNFAASGTSDKVLWIGGMKEMGKDEMLEHEQLVHYIQQYPWKEVILVGNEFKGLPHRYKWFDSSDAAKTFVTQHKPEESFILIKGSRGSKMEKMLEALRD